MAIRITGAMLNLLGSRAHHSGGCQDVRRMLALGGAVEPIELHAYEIEDIRKHREEAAQHTRIADAIEARGPWPEVSGNADAAGE